MTDSRFRIFASSIPHGVGPPRPVQAFEAQEVEPELPNIERDHMLEAVAHILDGQPESGESVLRGFDRKERELRAFFDRLDPDDRAALLLRLTAGADDPIIAKLARLSTERRQRLIASLAEAPRRRVR